MYTLRPYQADSVKAVIHYFRKHSTPAVIVLPTGAGKSLVIAELARLAKGRVLVLAHVKELVEQNHAKYEGYGLKGAIFFGRIRKKGNRPTSGVCLGAIGSAQFRLIQKPVLTSGYR